MRAVAALLAAALLSSCALRADGPVPDPAYGVALAEGEAVSDFHARALRFYGRLALRRFNTRTTYRDPQLRQFFRSETAFADYYADLAQALVEAAFERNRPLAVDLLEFRFDAPGLAWVELRLVGEDGRPLRLGETALLREDRWERVEGSWWLVPGKL